MSLSKIFISYYPREERLPKNLRNNAREAAEYLTGQLYEEDPDQMRPIGRPGRSSGTNN
jgi:hypothetical protein